MKKVLATILAFIYLSTSMGATVHLHYCMGKLASWELFNHGSKHCTFCGMSKKSADKNCITRKNSCCKDEQKQIKTHEDQKVTQSEIQLLKLYPDALVVHHLMLQDSRLSSFAIAYPAANAPPLIGKVPVFLFNCNFRI